MNLLEPVKKIYHFLHRLCSEQH